MRLNGAIYIVCTQKTQETAQDQVTRLRLRNCRVFECSERKTSRTILNVDP